MNDSEEMMKNSKRQIGKKRKKKANKYLKKDSTKNINEEEENISITDIMVEKTEENPIANEGKNNLNNF